MPGFLLDEHISPAVCSIVRQRRNEIAIESVIEWQFGSLRGKDAAAVLTAAAQAGFVWVTYDLRTIPALLREWAAKGLSHQGVIFVDEGTCRPLDLAGIAEAVIRIWDSMQAVEWTDRVTFASRHR